MGLQWTAWLTAEVRDVRAPQGIRMLRIQETKPSWQKIPESFLHPAFSMSPGNSFTFPSGAEALSLLIPSAGGQWEPGSPAQWEQPCRSILGTELVEATLLCQPSPGCGTWALLWGAGGSSSLSPPVLTAWSCAGVLSAGVAPQGQPGSRCCPGHRHSWTQQRLYLP